MSALLYLPVQALFQLQALLPVSLLPLLLLQLFPLQEPLLPAFLPLAFLSPMFLPAPALIPLQPVFLLQVLQVLQSIVGERRAVGLISHVPLVQQAVPNGFTVHKGANGSQIEVRSM